MKIENAQEVIEMLASDATECALSQPDSRVFASLSDALTLAQEAIREKQERENTALSSIEINFTPHLKPCPLCGERLIVRTERFDGDTVFTARCDCGFTFRSDLTYEQFVSDCDRRAQTIREENPPLSLDELKGIAEYECDTAIWIYDLNDGSTVRGIIAYIDGQGIAGIWCVERGNWYRCWNYGKEWLAYRYKPEQE